MYHTKLYQELNQLIDALNRLEYKDRFSKVLELTEPLIVAHAGARLADCQMVLAFVKDAVANNKAVQYDDARLDFQNTKAGTEGRAVVVCDSLKCLAVQITKPPLGYDDELDRKYLAEQVSHWVERTIYDLFRLKSAIYEENVAAETIAALRVVLDSKSGA